MKNLTIKDIHEGLQTKKFSAKELTNHYLERISKDNKDLNVYLTVTEKEALAQAEKVDAKVQKGEKLRSIEGVPVAIKDIFSTKDIRTTASSKMLDTYVPAYEATVTQKLLDQGTITLGKTNCDVFAFGASTENSGYGPTKNPWNRAKVPGGSSGGSAAAVAGDLCTFALGTDTGGSIRQPASLTGIVGLKLTYGRASRYGLLAMASSFDTPGPLTKSVEDAALVAEAIAGHDPFDGTTFDKAVPTYSQSLSKGVKGMKLAVLKASFEDAVESDVKNALQDALKVYEKLGATIDYIDIPELKHGIAVYYILVPSEISSNMARYDTVRYGQRSQEYNSIIEMQMNSRGEFFEDEVKRRVMLGSYALSAGYYDAYYLKAAKVRQVMTNKLKETFKSYDAVICPTSPTVAFDIGSKADDPLAMYLCDIFTVPVNIAGVPGLSIPCGFSKDGLPVGMQIIGDTLQEEKILQIGYAYERETEWHTMWPNK